MKDYSNIVGKVTSSPWMITGSALKMILEILDSHMSGNISHEEIRARFQDRDRDGRESRVRNHRGVGVMSLSGPIYPKANLMTELSGAVSIEQFRQDFRAMVADDGISSILIDVDSPGGMSDQIEEMAAEIFDARQHKKVISIANTAANSAAYYLASQATEMYATPSAQLGSVGTYVVHHDEARKQEMQGVKDTIISAGRFKAVTLEPLTEDGKTYLQDYVNGVNDLFVNSVARGRGVSSDKVRSDFGEGGVVTPNFALDAGMIDGVATFDEVLSSMVQESGAVAGYGPRLNSTVGIKQADIAKEHSEPGTGTGGEPVPREEPEEGDPAIKGGWRRDTPPIAVDAEERSVMDRAQLEAFAARLGIEFDTEMSDEDLSTKVTDGFEEVVGPLLDVSAEKRAFRAEFPDEWQEIQELRETARSASAQDFTRQFERFEDGKKGYSSLMCEKIEDAHVKIASRIFTHEDLAALLTSAAVGVVDLSEDGSSRGVERTRVSASGDRREVRMQYAELVREKMREDGLDRKAAMALVNEDEPELAAAYINS